MFMPDTLSFICFWHLTLCSASATVIYLLGNSSLQFFRHCTARQLLKTLSLPVTFDLGEMLHYRKEIGLFELLKGAAWCNLPVRQTWIEGTQKTGMRCAVAHSPFFLSMDCPEAQFSPWPVWKCSCWWSRQTCGVISCHIALSCEPHARMVMHHDALCRILFLLLFSLYFFCPEVLFPI
jgi:hypothetical protein